MNKKQPININPLSIRLPIMAMVSIFHRIAGILVFLLIPLLLWTLEHALVSPEGLAEAKDLWQSPLCKGLGWIFLSALVFHLFAGIRHLLMDVHIGDSRCGGRLGAQLVLVGALVALIAVSFWFWGMP